MAISTSALGMNARNFIFIRQFNKGRAKRIADDKIKTKKILLKHDVPTSQLITIFKNREAIRDFDWQLPAHGFVIKPARGYGGEGIIAFQSWNGTDGITTSGRKYSKADIESHLYDVLDGVYSLQYLPDIAYIEELIHPDPFFQKLAPLGLADIRIIIFNKVPVMAMMRLPTKQSEGKANIHMGAIAVGINMRNGEAVHALVKNKDAQQTQKIISPIIGTRIPDWDKVLLMAARAQEACGLGYAGVDIVMDKNKGPLVLEINARPGLSIQIANQASLRTRLERLENLPIPSAERGVELAKSLFGEKEAGEEDNTKILDAVEQVSFQIGDTTKTYLAKLDTGAYRTSLDEKLVEELNLKILDRQILIKSASGVNTRKAVKVSFILHGRQINSVATIVDRSHLKYPLIVGRKDLKGFLINPALPKEMEDVSQEDDNDE
jgi:alpha-L-glutamate ligase-like protein